MTSKHIINELDKLIPNPKCELNYHKDYELLIATLLSAQSTDKRVNMVTSELFSNYNIFSLCEIDLNDLENIIRPVGTFKRKAVYIKEVARRLVTEHNGKVPNNREYIESLPGCGRKTANVVLSNLFEYPAIAVDTHVLRVSKRLNITEEKDNEWITEQKLMEFFPKDKWSRIHHQLVLFGRYTCTSRNPHCDECPFKNECKFRVIK